MRRRHCVQAAVLLVWGLLWCEAYLSAQRTPGLRRLRPLVAASPAEIGWLDIGAGSGDADVAPSSAEATVLPLFPLGILGVPGAEIPLSIFEPRYRQMVQDILLKERKFAMTFADVETGKVAKVGVVMYLENLKEISEETNDAIKYMCTHTVVDRCEIVKILNPKQHAARETYVEAEVRILEDTEVDESTAPMEKAVLKAMVDVAKLQVANDESVRIEEAALANYTAAGGRGEGTLWSMIQLWKHFLELRRQATASRIQRDIQQRLVEFIQTEYPQGQGQDAPSSVDLKDLPPQLQNDLRNVGQTVLDETRPVVDEATYGIQRLLETHSHLDRLNQFREVVENERKRLDEKNKFNDARASLEDLVRLSRPPTDDAPPLGGGDDDDEKVGDDDKASSSL